jgi:hypothetical protein
MHLQLIREGCTCMACTCRIDDEMQPLSLKTWVVLTPPPQSRPAAARARTQPESGGRGALGLDVVGGGPALTRRRAIKLGLLLQPGPRAPSPPSLKFRPAATKSREPAVARFGSRTEPNSKVGGIQHRCFPTAPRPTPSSGRRAWRLQ